MECQTTLADIRKHGGGMRTEEVAEAVREKKIRHRKWKREKSKEAWMEYKKCRQSEKERYFLGKAKETRSARVI